MIVAFAGRRAESLDGDPEALANRIRDILLELEPDAVVGSAADGTDLMVLRAALDLSSRPSIRVVLPTTPAVFRRDSVEPPWWDRFDATIREIAECGGRMESLSLPPSEDAYRRANQLILDRAVSLAGVNDRVVVLMVAWPGQGAMIGDLIDRARSQGLEMIRIDPAATTDDDLDG